MTVQDELIGVISDASDHYGDKLIEFLNQYRLQGLQDATPTQLNEFITQHLKKEVYQNGRCGEMYVLPQNHS